MASPPPKLLDQVRAVLRSKHYSLRTEESYIGWIIRYIHFHQKRHPRDLGPADIAAFLSYLAVEQQVAASTQNQARSALLFLYREVLGIAIDEPQQVVAAKTPHRLPTVLTKDEVRVVFAHLNGVHRLMAHLLYGSGLRLMECMRLRVKDLDFAQHQITVRAGKGMEDRVTMLPVRLVEPLQDHLRLVRRIHTEDLERGHGAVYLPFALERKYPNANREWGWQYVSSITSTVRSPQADTESGQYSAALRVFRAAPATSTARRKFAHDFSSRRPRRLRRSRRLYSHSYQPSSWPSSLRDLRGKTAGLLTRSCTSR